MNNLGIYGYTNLNLRLELQHLLLSPRKSEFHLNIGISTFRKTFKRNLAFNYGSILIMVLIYYNFLSLQKSIKMFITNLLKFQI